MPVGKKSNSNHGGRRLTKGQRKALDDIIFCLDYLQRQANRAGFSEVADLIGVARLAGDDATGKSGAFNKRLS